MTAQPKATTPDVLIVGAGPTGLTTAIELARRGVNFRIVDKKARAQHANALVMHARTLESLDLMGVADRFVKEGYEAPGIDLGSDSEKPIRAEMHRLDSRFPFILVIPQNESERLLEEHLAELGVVVERGTTFLGYEEQRDGVVARLEHPDGQGETVSARFLVGTDGAHSSVRRAADISFGGRAYDYVFFTAEAKVDGGLPKGGISQYSSERGLAFVVPFKDDYFRFVTADWQYQGESAKEPLTQETMQESVDALIPTRPTLQDPRWLSRWGSGIRQASRYRKGNVFLAGDAAHVHSPAGGQGMNTGVQDGFNLGWKLAFVVSGAAPAALLDTYEQERHPVGKRAVRTSDQILRSLIVRNGALRNARELLVKTLVPRMSVQKALSEGLSGVGISYKDAARARGELRGDLRDIPHPDALRAGDRVPDLGLAAPDGWPGADELNRVRLFDLMRPGYTLFVVIGTERAGDNLSGRLEQLGHEVRAEVSAAVKVVGILGQGTPKAGRVPIFADFGRAFQDKLGARDGSALLVRPDGYLAFHRRGYQAGLREMQGRWLQRTAPEAQAGAFTALPLDKNNAQLDGANRKSAN